MTGIGPLPAPNGAPVHSLAASAPGIPTRPTMTSSRRRGRQRDHDWRVSDRVPAIGRPRSSVAPVGAQVKTTADHFRLDFGCPLISHVLGLIGAVSGFHELEAEKFVMLSPLPSERRRSQRLQAAPNQADLEWRDRSQTRSSQGNILNISSHGALVSSDSFPGLGENVLIRLKQPVRSDWIGSIVVRHDQQKEVGIDFILDCPYDLLLAATVGIDIISSVLNLSGSDRFSNSGA